MDERDEILVNDHKLTEMRTDSVHVYGTAFLCHHCSRIDSMTYFMGSWCEVDGMPGDQWYEAMYEL